jgi:D-arabinose 1-dehydrogenase-like Zn-dependent alcohol dehydrogenase
VVEAGSSRELAHWGGVEPRVQTYPLEGAGEALDNLRTGEFEGAAVAVP